MLSAMKAQSLATAATGTRRGDGRRARPSSGVFPRALQRFGDICSHHELSLPDAYTHLAGGKRDDRSPPTLVLLRVSRIARTASFVTGS
jgi:hypothetical protein